MSRGRLPDTPDLRTHAAPKTLLERALRADQRRRHRQRVGLGMGLGAALIGLAVLAARGPSAPVAPGPPALATAAPQTVVTTLTLTAQDAGRVEVAGSWSGWTPEPMLKGGDRFTLDVTLPPGRYEYIFLVDGQFWRADPAAPLSRDDGFGHTNSILNI